MSEQIKNIFEDFLLLNRDQREYLLAILVSGHFPLGDILQVLLEWAQDRMEMEIEIHGERGSEAGV